MNAQNKIKENLFIQGLIVPGASGLYSLIYVSNTLKNSSIELKDYLSNVKLCIDCKKHVDTKIPPLNFKVVYTSNIELDEDIITCILFIVFGNKYIFGGRFNYKPFKDNWIKLLDLESIRDMYMGKIMEQIREEGVSVNDDKHEGHMYFVYFGFNKDKSIWLITQDSETSEKVQRYFEPTGPDGCIVFSDSTSKAEISAKVAILKWYLSDADICGGKYWYPTMMISSKLSLLIYECNKILKEKLKTIPFCGICKFITDHSTNSHGVVPHSIYKQEEQTFNIEYFVASISDMKLKKTKSNA